MSLNKIQSFKPTFYIPVKLRKRLETIHNYPLVVIEGASGFGKTTAISEYLLQIDACNVYSYTCMGEPLRKAWKGICSAFSHIDKSVANQLEALEYPAQENLVDIVEIMSGCNVHVDTWFIMDNFQYIQDELPDRILYPLSRHGCPRLHLVVITQSVASMDISGIPPDQGVLIQNNDFFFQKEDTNAYFRANGIVLSREELNRIQMLSEGWVAVLNLQLMRYLQEGDFEASDSIDKLIRSVIWKGLEPKEQCFFTAVSLLERFNVNQAYIIMGKDSLTDGILQLLGGGSFIHYEEDSGFYTLHSLLKSFLRKNLKGLPANEIIRIQKLAADAYAAIGEYYYALCGYLEASEWEALLSLPLRASDFSLNPKDTNAMLLERVLRECDREILVSHPQTLSMITFELFRAGNYGAFRKGCLLMEEMICQPEHNGLHEDDTRILTGQLALLKSFIAFNDIEKMSRLHRRAWEVLGGPFSNRSDWDDSWTFGQPSVLYLFWSASGALDRELAYMDECLPYYTQLTEGHGTGADCAMRAEALLMCGEDIEAEALCHKAIYLASGQDQDSICIAAEMTLLRMALLRGDMIDFDKAKYGIMKRAETGIEPAVRRMADLVLSFVSVLIEDKTVSEWLRDLDRITASLYDVAIPFGVLTYLRWLLAQGQDAKLMGIAQGSLPAVEQHNFLLPQIYFHLFIAIGQHRLGKKDEAQAEMDIALSLALPDKIYLPFAEYGEILAPLLKLKENQTGMDKLLALCRRQKIGVDKIRKATRNAQLAPRERQVAYLAADGLTNREVATRLHISQETVKTTMKSIFQKLGIRSRVQLQNFKETEKG